MFRLDSKELCHDNKKWLSHLNQPLDLFFPSNLILILVPAICTPIESKWRCVSFINVNNCPHFEHYSFQMAAIMDRLDWFVVNVSSVHNTVGWSVRHGEDGKCLMGNRPTLFPFPLFRPGLLNRSTIHANIPCPRRNNIDPIPSHLECNSPIFDASKKSSGVVIPPFGAPSHPNQSDPSPTHFKSVVCYAQRHFSFGYRSYLEVYR